MICRIGLKSVLFPQDTKMKLITKQSRTKVPKVSFSSKVSSKMFHQNIIRRQYEFEVPNYVRHSNKGIQTSALNLDCQILKLYQFP